jgi:hypothetical protein
MLKQFKFANDILLQGITARTQHQPLENLWGKPFWIWDQKQHEEQIHATNGKCCFNHIVGLPQKDKKDYPIFDYEKLLYDSLMSVDANLKTNIFGLRRQLD